MTATLSHRPTPAADPIIPDHLATPKHASFKNALVSMGQGAIGSALAGPLQKVAAYLSLGVWLRNNGFTRRTIVRDRRALFAHVADVMGRDKPMMYLEFGVYKGASIQAWTRLNTHPRSQFIGFDSFKGMPEPFDEVTGVLEGELNVGGKTPAISDERVSWQVGWFKDTLPSFEIPQHDRLLIHIDSDLYSATREPLEALDSAIVPGTVIMFDDMGSPHDEPRAFAEYMRRTGKQFELIACDKEDHYAFRCVG